jgi:hypothetical protein
MQTGQRLSASCTPVGAKVLLSLRCSTARSAFHTFLYTLCSLLLHEMQALKHHSPINGIVHGWKLCLLHTAMCITTALTMYRRISQSTDTAVTSVVYDVQSVQTSTTAAYTCTRHWLCRRICYIWWLYWYTLCSKRAQTVSQTLLNTVTALHCISASAHHMCILLTMKLYVHQAFGMHVALTLWTYYLYVHCQHDSF